MNAETAEGAAPGQTPPRPRLLTSPQLIRSLLIAAAVCAWLTAFNQSDRILAGTYDLLLGIRIALNFATPFTVSTVTTVWNNLRTAK